MDIKIERKKGSPKVLQIVHASKVLTFEGNKKKFSINRDDYPFVQEYFDLVNEKEKEPTQEEICQ